MGVILAAWTGAVDNLIMKGSHDFSEETPARLTTQTAQFLERNATG